MSKRLFTPEQETEIVQRYELGESSDKIGLSLGTNGTTIRNILKRHVVVKRASASQRNPPITNSQRSRIIELCAAGGTVDEAAAAVGVHRNTAWRIANAEGVTLKPGKRRTCEVNDHAFDVLTPEALYWMGFLWADGCVYHEVIKTSPNSRRTVGAPSLVIGLAECDRGHLEKLRSFLGSTHEIQLRTETTSFGGGPAVYLKVRSEPLCTALESHGFTTKRTRVPDQALATSRDFWRGMVDGDGSIGIHKSGNHSYPGITLAGQRALLEVFKHFLTANGLPSLNPYLGKGVWSIGTTGSTVRSIIACLYEQAPVFLDRKEVRAREILSR